MRQNLCNYVAEKLQKRTRNVHGTLLLPRWYEYMLCNVFYKNIAEYRKYCWAIIPGEISSKMQLL